MLHREGLDTDLLSTRMVRSWRELRKKMTGYDMLIMNVRSYSFPFAFRAAKEFKRANPEGIVLGGGMHATVAPEEMVEIDEFDHICNGAGEEIIVDLARDPGSFPRVILGKPAESMASWPMIDRTLWPDPGLKDFPWPLEPECGWGPGPVATILTSRVCPWQCTFCNESSYIPTMARKPVDQVIEELNYLDDAFGPIGSVVIHDSMFFQQPRWLKEMARQISATCPQTLAVLGGGSGRYGPPVARPIRGADSRDELGHDLARGSNRAATGF